MSNQWFRLYHEFADDPKVQMMPEHMQRRLIMLFCEQCSDVLATFSEREIAFHWRVSDAEVAETKALFIAKGFIDERWNILNWDHRQFISDSSTERTRRYRERRRTSQNSHGDGDVTKCDALEQNRTEQIQNRAEQSRRARVEKSGEPGSEDQKDLVGSVGEGLEKLEEPKSSLQPEGEETKKEITPSCVISSNSSHLPDNNYLQDESGDAGVPETTQQPPVEPPVTAKTPENQPAPVILDNWPADVDRSEAAKNLLRAHPRPAMGWGAVTAVIDQVVALAKERGESQWDAYNWLRGRVEAYRAATDKWPPEEKSFITGVLNWLTNEEYRHDDAIWSRGSNGEGNNTLLDRIIQNVLVEGRSTEPGGGTYTPSLDPESIRRKRESARASSLGPRPGFAHRRAF